MLFIISFQCLELNTVGLQRRTFQCRTFSTHSHEINFSCIEVAQHNTAAAVPALLSNSRSYCGLTAKRLSSLQQWWENLRSHG